jgi:hypothetical protein
MADIVPSLFGFSPQMYQQQQQDRADAQALRFAELDPFQQANYAIGRGAYGLAGAIGGALGGQDPELQRITRAQQVASQIDFTNPESFRQGMAALGDDIQSKQQLAQIFRQQQESGALIGQRNAAAQASIAQATRERGPTGDVAKAMRVGEITRALQTPELNPLERSGLEAELSSLSPTKAKEPTTNEITNAAAFAATKGEPGTPAYTAAFRSKFTELIAKAPAANIKEVGVAENSRAPVYLDVNNNEQFTFGTGPDGKQVRVPFTGGVDRTTAKTTVTSTQTQESEFAKQLGGEQSKRYSGAVALRDNAISAVKTFNELAKLDDQGLVSGTFATGRVGATNLLNTLGLIGNADVGKLARSENYQKIAGDAILATLGGRLGAGFSNEDRKFIQGLIPQLENSAAARRQLIDYMLRKNNEVVGETNRLIDYAETKRTLNGFKPAIPLAASTANRYSGMSDAELDAAIAAAKTKK